MIPMKFGIIGAKKQSIDNVVIIKLWNEDPSKPLPWCRRDKEARDIDKSVLGEIIGKYMDYNNVMVFLSTCTDYWYLYEKYEELRKTVPYNVVTPFITTIPFAPRAIPQDWVVYIIDKNHPIKLTEKFLRYNPDVYPLLDFRKDEKPDPRIMKPLEKILRRHGKVIVTTHLENIDAAMSVVIKLMDIVDEIIVDSNICEKMKECRPVVKEIIEYPHTFRSFKKKFKNR